MSTTDYGVSARASGDSSATPVRRLPTSSVGHIELDRITRLVIVDAAVLSMFSSTQHQFGCVEEFVNDRVHPDDRDSIRAAIDTDSPGRHHRFRGRIGAGERYRWFEARCQPRTGDPAYLAVTIVDIDELMSEQQQLRSANDDLANSNRFHQAVIAATPDAVHIFDIGTKSLSRAVDSPIPLHDFSAEATMVISGQRIAEFVPAEDRRKLQHAFKRAEKLSEQRTASLRHRVIAHDGTVYWLRRRIGVLDRDESGRATSLVVVSSEITDVVAVEQRVEYAATHDETTGLVNRRKFVAELGERLERGDDTVIAVLDIQGLRTVSDTRGRDAGERVLSAVSRRLCAAVRKDDVVARLADAEFGLLIAVAQPGPVAEGDDAVDGRSQMERILERVEQVLAEPFYLGDDEISLSASLGICTRLADAGAEAMLTAANAAMDKVRRSGEGGRFVFDRSLQDDIRSQEKIERNLRRALRENSLEVHYQPIVSPRTGRVASVEALVRLRDEDGCLLPVDAVIATAERCALISELDDQMLAKSSRQVALWRQDPQHRTLRLALNRSAKDLNRPGFYDRIMRGLAESGLPADALMLEVTETVLLHLTSSRIDEMTRLRDSRVGLAIDDFGTGYASLSQLVSLPITRIKIDRSFTSRVLEDPTCAALVAASVRIASDLGLSCVVEGVETVEQLEALPDYNQLLIQGYLYGRPRPCDEGLGLNAAITAKLRPFHS